jgi:hypothetical protein
VREGAVAGDGGPGAPFGTIAEAVALAMSGDVIAVASGTYAEALVLPDGVALVGACATQTIIEGPAGTIGDATIRLADGTSVRDVTVIGARPGLQILAGEARTREGCSPSAW